MATEGNQTPRLGDRAPKLESQFYPEPCGLGQDSEILWACFKPSEVKTQYNHRPLRILLVSFQIAASHCLGPLLFQASSDFTSSTQPSSLHPCLYHGPPSSHTAPVFLPHSTCDCVWLGIYGQACLLGGCPVTMSSVRAGATWPIHFCIPSDPQ